MSIQSIGNGLTPQQIMQMALQGQLGNADPNGTAATTADQNQNAGQKLPTGTNDQADAPAAAPAVTSGQNALDPKTIMALLQIQESRTMQAADTLIFGDNAAGASTGDPLLDALNANSADPKAVDPMQSLLSNLTTNASANDALSSANQTLLDYLKGAGDAGPANDTSRADTISLASTNA